MPERPAVGQVALVRGESPEQVGQQLFGRGDGDRPRVGVGDEAGRVAVLHHPADGPLQLAVLADLDGQLVAGHFDQQADQLARLGQVELAGRGADEEAGQDRLAHVHRIELAAEAGVGQADADGDPHGPLVPADEFGRRVRVPAADAGDPVGERRLVVRHARTPDAGCGLV